MGGCAASCPFPQTDRGWIHLWQPALDLALVSQPALACVVAELGRMVVLEEASVGKVFFVGRVGWSER